MFFPFRFCFSKASLIILPKLPKMQQITHWSCSISILLHNKRRKNKFDVFSFFQHSAFALKNSRQYLTIRTPRRKRLHVFVTSFKQKNDVKPSYALSDVIFPVTNDVSYHTFSLRFQSCELLFDHHYFNIGSTGEAC